jgi:hypothetical protein
MMQLSTLADWLAWGALLLPLAVLAWSARDYIKIQTDQSRQKEFDNFFETILRVHNKDKALISQKAAIFELRHYPRYKELVLRICDNYLSYIPGAPNELKEEFTLTAEYFRARGRRLRK